MTVESLHHVQLAMPPGSEDAATEFYEGLLGLPRIAKPPHLEARGGCWFETGTTRVHLGVEQEFRPARKAHVALRVSDVSHFRAHLAASGVDIIDDEPLPGFDRFYVNDPFGNRLEFLAPVRRADRPQDQRL